MSGCATRRARAEPRRLYEREALCSPQSTPAPPCSAPTRRSKRCREIQGDEEGKLNAYWTAPCNKRGSNSCSACPSSRSSGKHPPIFARLMPSRIGTKERVFFFREGDQADSMFVLEAGKADVLKSCARTGLPPPNPAGGDCFGRWRYGSLSAQRLRPCRRRLHRDPYFGGQPLPGLFAGSQAVRADPDEHGPEFADGSESWMIGCSAPEWESPRAPS